MRIWSVGSKYYVDTMYTSVNDIKSFMASRIGLRSDEVGLVSRGRNIVTDEDLQNDDKIFALCKYSSVDKSEKIASVTLKGKKIHLRVGESILDLKKKATEIGLMNTAQHKVILNGKIVQDNFILADICMFVGSTRLSAIITSAGDEIRIAFNKDILCDRLQKLPQRKRSKTLDLYRGLRRKNMRQKRLMPAFNKSPKVTPVKAR